MYNYIEVGHLIWIQLVLLSSNCLSHTVSLTGEFNATGIVWRFIPLDLCRSVGFTSPILDALVCAVLFCLTRSVFFFFFHVLYLTIQAVVMVTHRLSQVIFHREFPVKSSRREVPFLRCVSVSCSSHSCKLIIHHRALTSGHKQHRRSASGTRSEWWRRGRGRPLTAGPPGACC